MSLAAAALDMQIDLLRFTRSPLGIKLSRGMAEQQDAHHQLNGLSYESSVTYDPSFEPFVQATYDAQLFPLMFGQTFAVTTEIGQLIESAAHTLPDFEVHRDDVPSQRGFVYLEEAIVVHDDVADRPLVIKAIGWATAGVTEFDTETQVSTKLDESYGVVITVWTDPRDPRDHMAADLPDEYRSQLPPLFFLSYQAHQWDTSFGENRDMSSAQVLRWVYALWRFIQEPFIDGRAILPDRPAQKRAIRAGRPTAEVRVVRLRKKEQRHRPDAEQLTDDEILWSHRWLVQGHWRNQWYPSQRRHAPKWISGYVKGPEHLPLLVKDTVFSVDR